MLSNEKIQEKKALFNLPYQKDQLEYWGPLNHSFADSFLTMGHKYLYQYFSNLDKKTLKNIFSSFVEMVQNVSEYNMGAFADNFPHSYIRLRDVDGSIYIHTANLILEKDLFSVKTIFEANAEIPEDKLVDEYKRLLFNSGSLGIIMLRKLKNSTFEYSLTKSPEGDNWLSLELKINYGNT